MIPQSFIDDLLTRLDIVDVVGKRIQLKRAGANHTACCPFHDERSPSFTVSPSKQFYHCFGCGAHGTAIRFVMEYESLGFVEAIESLAGTLGLEVPNERGGTPEPARTRAETLRPLLDAAASFYRLQLKNSPRAIDYLKRRGLTGPVARDFGLGYAPDGWDALSGVFPDYRSNDALVECGLVIAGDTGKRHDRFRDRIMFPISDSAGRLIGFGGRILDRGEPKYLNSPETPLFNKGRELFGLWPARTAMKKDNRAIVVEGYMDVVALAQHGIANAVATLGTATTPAHVQKLLRSVDEVVFCFDGDAAGQRAAWRALENSLGVLRDDVRLKFLFLPQGEDPDSFVRSVGAEGFRAALTGSLSLADFLIQELQAQAQGDSVESRAQLVHRAEPLLRQIEAPALALLLRKRVAEVAGLSTGEVNQLISAAPARRDTRQADAPTNQRQPAGLLEALLLARLLRAPQFAGAVNLSTLPPASASDPTGTALRFVLDTLTQWPTLSADTLAERLRETPHFDACRKAVRLIRDLPDDIDFGAEIADLARRASLTPAPSSGDLAAMSEAERAAWLAGLRQRKGVAPDNTPT